MAILANVSNFAPLLTSTLDVLLTPWYSDKCRLIGTIDVMQHWFAASTFAAIVFVIVLVTIVLGRPEKQAAWTQKNYINILMSLPIIIVLTVPSSRHLSRYKGT